MVKSLAKSFTQSILARGIMIPDNPVNVYRNVCPKVHPPNVERAKKYWCVLCHHFLDGTAIYRKNSNFQNFLFLILQNGKISANIGYISVPYWIYITNYYVSINTKYMERDITSSICIQYIQAYRYTFLSRKNCSLERVF